MYESLLLDTFGRTATDLRISVTDRCNLRCVYCLPEKVTDWLKRSDLLRPEEFRRLAKIAATLGVTQARITGGEPLLRPDLPQIVEAVREGFEDAGVEPDLALTTNGIGLDRVIDSLVDAGLQRLNVSIDSLDPVRFAELSRRKRSSDVLRGLDAVDASALPGTVKLNTVVVDQQSLAEIPALVTFALERGYQWRAIEFMPIGPLAASFSSRPTAHDIQRVLRESFELTDVITAASEPARRWSVAPGDTHPGGIIGVIASMTSPFCASCTRTRLSADGKIYSCLFSVDSVDLHAPMRAGASDEELAELWKDAMWAKPAGHQLLAPVPQSYSMSKIGG